jgi:hypothetical protein
VAAGQATKALPKPAGPPRVLLLPGLPDGLLPELAHHAGALLAEPVEGAAAGLKQLRAEPAVMDAIRGGGWGFVVLTGHPTFGRTLVIDGETRVADPSDFLHHGKLLVAQIRQTGGRAVLLEPPRKPESSILDQQAIDWAYNRLGREGGAILAPVGDAFARLQYRRTHVSLFDVHGERWSPAGAFLAAAVLEATITGRPPIPPSRSETKAAASELSLETRQLLGEVAWEAVRDLAAAGGYRDVPPPPFPTIPTLPHGAALKAGSLQGRWRGPIRLYPWPARLEVEVTGEGDTPRVRARVGFETDRRPIGFEGADVAVHEDVLSFLNPSDLAHGRTQYRLVKRGRRLEGVAELVTEDGGIYAIGSFELDRVPPSAESAEP